MAARPGEGKPARGLWMIPDEMVYEFGPEEAVEEWETAVEALGHMQGVAGWVGNAAQMALWDAEWRAREALRRARETRARLEEEPAGGAESGEGP